MKRVNLNIKFKLVLILTVFVLISTGSVIYSLINIKNQKSDALIINLAGKQRALSQAISKSVLGLHNSLEDGQTKEALQRVEAYKNDIIEKKKAFSRTLAVLSDGGVIKENDTEVSIPETKEPLIKAKLAESKELWNKFGGNLDVIIEGKNPKAPDVAAAVRYVEDKNGELFKDMNKLTGMYQEHSDTKLTYFKNVLYIGIILNLLTFGAVIWFIHRLIIARLDELHNHMKDITSGEGDLTKRVQISNTDEIGVIGQEFNILLGNFEVVISKLMGSCGLLQQSSDRLNGTFSSMVDGFNKQDQKTGQVATAMEEMSATVLEVARSSSDMAEVASKADTAVKTGEASVYKVVERMNDIAASTKKSVEVVAALGSESLKIGNIVQVINDIADQTNLLALNAAIEAARAGDQGRGFAVVADEVRKLAERTTKATKEINQMITGIQEESKKAVESIERESKTVEEGVLLTKEAGSALNDITSSINHVNGMIHQIATSTEQQSAVASTISADMEAVADISRESANGVRGVSTLALELNELAEELERTLSKFKVSGSNNCEEEEEEFADDTAKLIPFKQTLAVNG
ncbi:MAG: methyl-accepting chemotaxis protein [Deltaproteobacteria bacterium]|nr:methyl-accepting chemotaxis protein [Deltaproteobacteria bacterium]